MSWRMKIEEAKQKQKQEMKRKEHAIEDALVSMNIAELNKAFDEFDRYMYYLHFNSDDAQGDLYGDFLERFQSIHEFELKDEDSGYGKKYQNRQIRLTSGNKLLATLKLTDGVMNLYQQRKCTSLDSLEERLDKEKGALSRHEKNIKHLELDVEMAEKQEEAEKLQARLEQVKRLKTSSEGHITRLEEELSNREEVKKELMTQEKMMLEIAKKHGFSVSIKE